MNRTDPFGLDWCTVVQSDEHGKQVTRSFWCEGYEVVGKAPPPRGVGGAGGGGVNGGRRGPELRLDSKCGRLEGMFPPGENPRANAMEIRRQDNLTMGLGMFFPSLGGLMKTANVANLAKMLLNDWDFKSRTKDAELNATYARAGNYNAGLMAAAARVPLDVIVVAGGAVEVWNGRKDGYSQIGPAALAFEKTEDFLDTRTGFECYGEVAR